MSKQLKCGDLVPGCDKVFEGKDDNEVMQKAGAHAASDHGFTSMTPEMIANVKSKITEKH